MDPTERNFTIQVLGRTLEHLGNQLYKRREPAIAELVANCWDAGSNKVEITVPPAESYDPQTSQFKVKDYGCGMSADDVQNKYLVVGRNRREDIDWGGGAPGPGSEDGRLIMGKKGIGKLAGFGMAKKMKVVTWSNRVATEITLNMSELRANNNEPSSLIIPGVLSDAPSDWGPSGTIVTLSELKHVTPIDLESLREELARRFARHVRGKMTIELNGEPLGEPKLEIESCFPDGAYPSDTGVQPNYESGKLEDGSVCLYRYAYSKETIKHIPMRGFVIYASGKAVQAPPFFFDVEGTASGQHGTRYVTGEIIADFIDKEKDSASDAISTDRQEIDWQLTWTAPLRKWGDALSRKVLREWASRKADTVVSWVQEDPDLKGRVEELDSLSRQSLEKHLKIVSQAIESRDEARHLADALVGAYEFRQFHEHVTEIENLGEDPDKLRVFLEYLRDWNVLESRAILQVMKGRLEIIRKFEQMVTEDTRETAHHVGEDNMHDLLARFPWLIDPDLDIYAEEKSLSKTLAGYANEDIKDPDERMRYDFLGLSGDGQTVVIEIKRSGHALSLDDVQRVEKYKGKLSRAFPNIRMFAICSNHELDKDTFEIWNGKSADRLIVLWSRLVTRAKRRYTHYQAILEKNVKHPDFAATVKEVAETRKVLQTGSAYRTRADRKEGMVKHLP
ncbi:MAG: ATP-binding protein [Nitrososphaerota archaeon]|nr:ATP-binding protein [Nitrososphaerota archaeon]